MEDTLAAMYAKGLHHMLRAEHIIILLLRAQDIRVHSTNCTQMRYAHIHIDRVHICYLQYMMTMGYASYTYKRECIW